MTFSPPTDLTQDRDFLRTFIDDDVEGEGPYPDGGNFPDQQIDNYLSRAGSLNGAYILMCQALAAAWTSFALRQRSKVGEFEAKEVAGEWQNRANEAREQPITEPDPGVVKLKRLDPYASLT